MTESKNTQQIFTVIVTNGGTIPLYRIKNLIEASKMDGDNAVFYVKGFLNWVEFQIVMRERGAEFKLLTR